MCSVLQALLTGKGLAGVMLYTANSTFTGCCSFVPGLFRFFSAYILFHLTALHKRKKLLQFKKNDKIITYTYKHTYIYPLKPSDRSSGN